MTRSTPVWWSTGIVPAVAIAVTLALPSVTQAHGGGGFDGGAGRAFGSHFPITHGRHFGTFGFNRFRLHSGDVFPFGVFVPPVNEAIVPSFSGGPIVPPFGAAPPDGAGRSVVEVWRRDGEVWHRKPDSPAGQAWRLNKDGQWREAGGRDPG